MNNDAFEAYNTKSLLPCEICGRTFREEALAKHLKGCKGGNYKSKSKLPTITDIPNKIVLPNINEKSINPKIK